MFRYQLACPIYCLMPDHLHLLWTGVAETSDQLLAMKSFRKDMNGSLGRIGFQLQLQAYDHVLNERIWSKSRLRQWSNTLRETLSVKN